MRNIVFALFLLLSSPLALFGQIGFSKITDSSNPVVNFSNNAAQYKGLAWIDFNNDGLTDLFVAPLARFQNLGGGNFLRLPDLTDPAGIVNPAGCSWGDINNDGQSDCVLALKKSALFLSDAAGNLNLSNSLLPNFDAYPAWDCSMADANNDGLLDLCFAHANGFHNVPNPQPCRFYLQQSGTSFQQITGFDFTDSLAAYTIPIWTDYDLDGDMDLFIGAGPAQNPPGALPDYCFKNLLKETGLMSLQRLSQFPFSNKQDGQTYNFVDYDFDGDLDICLTNYSQAPTRFYKNENGEYQSISTSFASGTVGQNQLSNCWADIDHDGDLDVFITQDGLSKVLFYRNKGDGSFETQQNAATTGAVPCGIAFADYDRDGDLDFYVNGPGNARGLFRNDSLAGDRNWAQFTLKGQQSNQSAIGAILRLKATVQGKNVWQIRQILAHNAFQSQSDLRQHFGLDQASQIDSLEVLWPSGLLQSFSSLAPNSFYVLKEGMPIEAIVQTIESESEPELSIIPNPINREFQIKCAEAIRSVEIFDVYGKLLKMTVESNTKGKKVTLNGNSAAGNYYIRIGYESGKQVIKKVIKI